VSENLDELADRWWAAQRLAMGTRDQRKSWSLGEPSAVFAGYLAARERLDQGGAEALELVMALLSSSPDGSGAATVGAGPLEDLVTQHGEELSPRIDELARRSPLFHQALGSVAAARPGEGAMTSSPGPAGPPGPPRRRAR